MVYTCTWSVNFLRSESKGNHVMILYPITLYVDGKYEYTIKKPFFETKLQFSICVRNLPSNNDVEILKWGNIVY